jgi:cell division protein FtsW
MGQQTYVRSKSTGNNPGQPLFSSFKLDYVLLLVTLALLVFGLVMVYSSSWNFSMIRYDTPGAAVERQAMWGMAGIVAAAFCLLLDYHIYRKLAVPIISITILLLLLVLIFPSGAVDTRGTLFGRSVQPSELAKIAIVIYLSVWLYSKRENLQNVSFGLIPLALIVGAVGGLIFLQPDISAALSIILLGGLLFFMANSEIRQIILLVLLVLIVGGLIIFISTNGRTRIIEYWNGLQDISSASDHIRFSLRAIVEGGWFGKGLGKGSVKVIGLPVAWTDSIYAVIAEELGLVGAFAVLGMYLVFLWRGIRIAHRAPDDLGKLLAGGITCWIIFEAVINIGVMVNIVPFAGNPLPFISTGGSSLLTSLAAVGILLNISRHGVDQPVKERSNVAAYRRSRRDRRRSVSGARSSASAQPE